MLIKRRKNPLFTLWDLNGSSFEQTWIPFTQGCFVPNFFNVFLLFCNYRYIPLEKGWALHLNKLKSSSPKRALCQVWLKLVQWFWRRRFLNFVSVFSLFRSYLPLGKGGALHLNKLESPSPKEALCQVWLKGEGDENVKSLRQRQQQRRTTDKFWSEKVTWAFGWGELKRTENCINTHSALLQKFCVLFLVDTSINRKNIRFISYHLIFISFQQRNWSF